MRGILPLRGGRIRAPSSSGKPPRPLRGHPSLRKEGIEKKKAARLFLLGCRLRATNSALFSFFYGFSLMASPLFSLAESAYGCELGGKRRQLGFYGGDFLLVRGVAPRFLGGFQRLGRLGFIEVVAADRGVGEHGHQLGLHFENSSRDEHQLLFPPAGRLDPHRARLDARDKGRMSRIDAQFSRFAREHDELGLARVDARLGGDDVDVYRVCHVLDLTSIFLTTSPASRASLLFKEG